MSRDPLVPQSWTSSETGSPSGSADTFPQWLTIAAVIAGAALLLVLLRFAIDLLGLVMVLVLIGFSIRALSDWLGDHDAVSWSSILAVALSLLGTVAIGTWLFDVKRMDPTGAIERRVPKPVTRAIDWAEQRGWGQRVLLPDRSFARPLPGGAASPARTPEPSLAIEIPPPEAPPPGTRPARQRTAAPSAASSGVAFGSRSSSRTAAAPAHTSRAAPAAGPESGPPREAAAPASRTLEVTRTTLTNSPISSVVGTSVRLTARVESDAGPPPAGSVVFSRGDQVLGTARLRSTGEAVSGFLIVLTLPVGEHEIVADYTGDDVHAPSRSASVRQVVVRR